MREIIGAFFSEKGQDKVNIGVYKKIVGNSSKQLLTEPMAFYCEIETTGYKVTPLDSQYVTFLLARELDSEE